MSPHTTSLIASLCFTISGVLFVKAGNPKTGFSFVAMGCIFYMLARRKRKSK